MHWGYRHYQPYSAGYQAQEKGVFLGQLADKLSYGATYAKGFLGSLFGQGKAAAKKKFDQWNQIDTSATTKQIQDLMRQRDLNQRMAGHYREKEGHAYQRLRREGFQEGTSQKIFDTLHDITATYDSRRRKAEDEIGRLYATNNPNLNTKTKRISAKIQDLMGLGSMSVNSIPNAVKSYQQQSRIYSAESQRTDQKASRDVASMLSSLAGLESQQTAMSLGELGKWMRDMANKGCGTEEQRAIDYEIQRRQKQGYRGDRDSIWKLVTQASYAFM
jgi:hypothetical protein